MAAAGIRLQMSRDHYCVVSPTNLVDDEKDAVVCGRGGEGTAVERQPSRGLIAEGLQQSAVFLVARAADHNKNDILVPPEGGQCG